MSDPLPYAHLLKHQPAQERSARRIEALLDAAAELLSVRDPEAITVRELAGAAEIPTGTIYQFFDDKNAVLQALAIRFLAAMPGVLEGVESPSGDWSRTVGRIVDAYAAMIREHPAIRALWLAGTLDAATRRVERATDATIAAGIGALLRTQAGVDRGTEAQWHALVALIDGLLRLAFTLDPAGDPATLREARRAARAYVAAIFAAT